jgi:hypothetical protein
LGKGKVVQLFTSDSVQEILCESADKGFTEVVVCGRMPDGTYHMKRSECTDTLKLMGVLEMVKMFLNESMEL